MNIAKSLAHLFQAKEALGKRILNVAHLLTGNLFTSLVSLLTFALTARALGPNDYGMLALVYSYTRAIERIVSFQSWQPLIKYGSSLSEDKDQAKFSSLIKFGLVLDVTGAVISWIVAIGLVLIAAPLFGWSDQTVNLVLIYSTVLLFRLTGMPTAVLRIYGRFRTIAYGQLGGVTFKLILCVIGILAGGGIVYFAFAWLFSQIVSSVVTVVFAFRQLHLRGAKRVLFAPLRGTLHQFPGIWNFAWSSNLSLTIRSSAQELDTLLVGALADPASAGLYNIAKRIGRMGQQVGTQVQAVLYPDLARLWAQRAVEEFYRAVMQIEVLLTVTGIAIFVLFYFLGEPLLRIAAGPEFAAASQLLIVQAVAMVLILSGSAMRSALLAMGQHRIVLKIVLVATVAFHATAILLIPQIGAMGANIAHIVLGLIWVVGLGIAFHRGRRSTDKIEEVPKGAMIVDDGEI
ncbi:oligosaccharide flippase family protein [Nordella sp. HKS 07]|uniref:oligosaccharide flippase family protein n=1 Tax=Nordella sp. HKS 07 TaxID=2712222 RepID=UPI0013E12CEE|nr:oligosaccharide flippase family protein [Nordella sp. HKS 07]QIG49932.1 oligosaccharide flippase family protein [Nordella sp. HKS 07]